MNDRFIFGPYQKRKKLLSFHSSTRPATSGLAKNRTDHVKPELENPPIGCLSKPKTLHFLFLGPCWYSLLRFRFVFVLSHQSFLISSRPCSCYRKNPIAPPGMNCWKPWFSLCPRNWSLRHFSLLSRFFERFKNTSPNSVVVRIKIAFC